MTDKVMEWARVGVFQKRVHKIADLEKLKSDLEAVSARERFVSTNEGVWDVGGIQLA